MMSGAMEKVYAGDGSDIPPMGLVKDARMTNNEKRTDEDDLSRRAQAQVAALSAAVSADYDKWLK